MLLIKTVFQTRKNFSENYMHFWHAPSTTTTTTTTTTTKTSLALC